MALNVKSVSDIFGKDVFTSNGEYYGKIADVKVDLTKFRLKSLVIEAARGTPLASAVGSKRGVIVPYQMVESIGDIVIIRQVRAPVVREDEVTGEAVASSGLPF